MSKIEFTEDNKLNEMLSLNEAMEAVKEFLHNGCEVLVVPAGDGLYDLYGKGEYVTEWIKGLEKEDFMEEWFEEIVVGADINEENSLIFAEFKEKFAEYIYMESSPQTALLSDEFFANEEKATEEMRTWLDSKGVSEDEWSFQ